jgi:hypothetical protein
MDGIGISDHSLKLSQGAAVAVVNAILSVNGIADELLKGVGTVPTAPAGSINRTPLRADRRAVFMYNSR